MTSIASLLLFLLWVLGPTTLNAQSISGQVRDSTTGGVVSGGFVVLLDRDGAEIARTLSGRDGGFSLRIPPAGVGPFRLRSERIGFGVSTSDPFDAPVGGALEMELMVKALPILLSAIEAREETECRTRPGEYQQTSVLWEEARKALAAASWTVSHQAYRYVSNMHERAMDRDLRQTLDEQFRPASGYQALPFRSEDPEVLELRGYIVEDGVTTYYGPDAHVLQHDRFLAAHCFSIVRDEDRENLVGLAFEPAPSRDLPDVEGVLWLDETSAELRMLEYRYANHPYDLQDDRVGGTIDFMATPSGAWIVHRWEIRMPVVELLNRSGRTETRVTGFYEIGGEVLSITNMRGERVYQAELAQVIGTVTDTSSGDHEAVRGAVVQIAGAWFADTTDAEGRFNLTAPLNGEYGVTYTTPRLDSLGFSPQLRLLNLARGRTDTLSLIAASSADIVASLCPKEFNGPGYRVLTGTVLDAATRRPIPDAKVTATWQSISADARQVRDRDYTWTSDNTGKYRICGLEVGRIATVEVSAENHRGALSFTFQNDGISVEGSGFFETESPVWRYDLAVSRER